MDRHDRPIQLAGICEWICLALLVGALASGMLLGSGGSATARAVSQILCVLCVLTGILSMALEGKLRILRSPLLAVLLALPVLALVQIVPGPWAEWSPLHWAHPPGAAVVSADRHATMQWFIWSLSLLGLLWVATHSLRTPRHVAVVVLCLASTLGASAVVGTALSTQTSKTVFGLFRLDDPQTPVVIRDSFQPGSALSTPTQSWTEVDDGTGTPLWFRRQSSEAAFAGFTSSVHWAICSVALLPLLLVQAQRRLRRPASEVGSAEWFGLPAYTQGVCLTLFALFLTGMVGWWADPLDALIAVSLMFVVGTAMCERGDRVYLISVGLLQLALVLAMAATRISMHGGFYWLADRSRQFLSDNVALARAFIDHLWLGCGLGAAGDVWPLYRHEPASVASQGSSALMFLVETGLTGAVLVIAAAAYLTGRWCAVRDELRSEERRLLAALFGGLTGLAAFALLGPGLETPVVMALFVVLIGCTARGLAGGFAPARVGGIHG